MDDQRKTNPSAPDDGQLSLSEVPPPDLSVRVYQAQLARAIGVSRQQVSRWARDGVITFSPVDGRTDFRRAVDRIMKHVDPMRTRSPALRALTGDWQTLVERAGRVADLEQQLATVRQQLRTALENCGLYSAWLNAFVDAIEELPSEQRTVDSHDWPDLIDDLFEAAGQQAGDLDAVEAVTRADPDLGGWLHALINGAVDMPLESAAGKQGGGET
jgi:hypothetical protein